jgi:DNA-binding MarR family transcriptional regulator
MALLRTADALWNASRAFFARWKLSPSQFSVLNLLRGVSDGLSQTELSRALVMHRSNVTGLVDRLEHRRLVARREDATDRRAWRVVLTPSGNALLTEILPHYYAVAEAVWAGMPLTRVRDFRRSLAQLETQSATLATRHAAGSS